MGARNIMAKTADRNSFDVVKDLLAAREVGLLDMQTLRDARPHIEDVVGRLERVKAMFPGQPLALGEGVYALVQTLGEAKRPLRFPLLSRVAALL